MPFRRILLRHSFLLIPMALLLLGSGCRGPQAPDPSMTAVRSGAGQDGAPSADWISPEDVARAEALGLPMRNADLTGADAMANRRENLFEPVYFEFDQSFVRPADRPILQEVAQYLEANPDSSLLVEGHCDWRGTTEYNMALGDRRAVSVLNYLTNLGIAPQRIETVSKGDLEAITEGSEEQMRQDRRADLIILL